jgi:pyruvate dehydrogenase E2 component (dihydrolipoamide acetyltransferase)
MTDSTATGTTAEGVKGTVTVLELDRQARAVARRSAEARAVVPHVEFGIEVDMEAALSRAATETHGEIMPLLVRAAADALSGVPRVNGAYRDGRYELYSAVNIGVTVDEDDVYVIPTLFGAGGKSTPEIAAELADLRSRARQGRLAPADLSGATFTVSAASGQVATVTPLIVPPQAAGLTAGPVRARPVVRQGAVVAGHTMALTLAADHRIVYAPHATAFLEAVKAGLEERTP